MDDGTSGFLKAFWVTSKARAQTLQDSFAIATPPHYGISDGDSFRQVIRIGDGIHYCTKVTMELQHNSTEKTLYDASHSLHAKKWTAGGGNSEGGRVDPAKHRRMMHMTANLRLDCFARDKNIESKVKDINKWYHREDDHGITWLFERTRMDQIAPVHELRAKMAQYLAGYSPTTTRMNFLPSEQHSG
ncbi:hypothetical protein MMC18_008728 [Xylographa bjoerkii]|nr:hypothetical protein [Xylographa bjoerkii]